LRIALQASRLALPPSDPRHAEIVGLLELFASSAEDVVALVPESAVQHRPRGLNYVSVGIGRSRTATLGFELRRAARLAKELEADVLYCLHPSAPWTSSVPFVIEETGRWLPELDGRGRLAEALSRAGANGASAVVIADDLPSADSSSARRAPPAVSAAFRAGGDAAPIDAGRWGLEAGYVVAWACGLQALRRLLAAWTWVDGSIGDSVALALLCGQASVGDEARRQVKELELEDSVQPLAVETASDLALLFRGARAYLGVESGPTPQALRWALASGAPIAAEATRESEAVTGDAAYLVPVADTRALGAAALTILVEEDVAEGLRSRGLKRAQAYAADKALAARLDIVRAIKDHSRFP
jgi:hypothetical protein